MRLSLMMPVALTAGLAAAACTEPGGGGDIVWSFCNGSPLAATYPMPGWLAYQDGTGSWRRVHPEGSTFRFSLRSELGGVSYVVEKADSVVWTTVYGSADELAAHPSSCPAPTSTASGVVQGFPANGRGGTSFVLRHGGAPAERISTTAGSMSFTMNTDAAAADLIASQSGGTQPMIIRRNQQLGSGSPAIVLDFSTAEAFAPERRSVITEVSPFCETLTSSGFERTTFLNRFTTTTTAIDMGSGILSSTQGTVNFVPATGLAAGDLHEVTVEEARRCMDGGTDERRMRGVVRYVSTPADQAITLGPALAAFTSEYVTGAPFLRRQVTLPVQSEYRAQWSTRLSGAQQIVGGGPSRVEVVRMFRGYAPGAAQVTLVPPDLRGVSGWNNSWALSTDYADMARLVVSASSDPAPWAGYPRSASAVAGASYTWAIVDRFFIQ